MLIATTKRMMKSRYKYLFFSGLVCKNGCNFLLVKDLNQGYLPFLFDFTVAVKRFMKHLTVQWDISDSTQKMLS